MQCLIALWSSVPQGGSGTHGPWFRKQLDKFAGDGCISSSEGWRCSCSTQHKECSAVHGRVQQQVWLCSAPPAWLGPFPLPSPRVEELGTWAGYGPVEELGPEASLTCGV